MLLQKSKKIRNGQTIKKIKLGGIVILKKVTEVNKVSYKFFGIPFGTYANKKMPTADKMQPISAFYTQKVNPKHLWIDHSLGGGTDVYSQKQFNNLKSKQQIWRVQYFPAYQKFLITVIDGENTTRYWIEDKPKLKNVLQKANFSEITVNNLVGYNNSLEMLEMVKELKSNTAPAPKVSFRGHDFQAICPSFNLLDKKQRFCGLKNLQTCEKCLPQIKLGTNSFEDKILRSGAENIAAWRKSWGEFFSQTIDEMIVFAPVIRDMFINIYPFLQNKIKVIPHQVQLLQKAEIPPHKGINIAVLGEISLPQKGNKIIRQMCKVLPNYRDVKIIIIGKYHQPPRNLRVTGRYNPQDLPQIMQKEKIDVIFIPSIWPETFSYTTAEAISMGLPVACYDLGAQAEQVKAYAEGLILQDMNPTADLYELINFVLKLRKEK
ncbi:MAG: glycosyltransferase family 4 protein [Alphaproteobacteria bacterium]|nr:glycosyltransferase family 4 protein [Alphaproteobacteria bacterium]